MHWSLYVLIGAVINVAVNFGYKTSAAKDNIFMMAALIMLVAFVTLTTYSFATKSIKLSELLIGWTPAIIIGMGVGSGLIMYFFIGAMSRGPLTLVDPLWACVYAVTSAVIGMALLREAPSLWALSGIGLYLAGAFLMARG